ncbi:MAG: mandelate racemase/muconate lactonizing enzyme family protein [Chloroflexi bacterium]|nr:mandelate racemase/muconate lactonizing enzyme family protein [Chloroflexota bacterium]
MQVAGFETQVIELSKERVTLGEIPGQVTPWYVTLRLRTDDGIEGIAYAAYVSRAVAPALKATLDGLCEQVVGRDPFETDAIGRDLRMRNGGTAPAGLVTRASSAIDVALWDIKGKALGLPCWKLLGGSEGRVNAYGSGHLWRHYNLEELQQWGPTLVEAGFKAMKLRCGAESSAADEVERMRVLREAVGEDVDIMIDINQGWTVHQATTIGRQLSEHRLYWLEDPTQHQDYAGMARIAAALDTPLCSGEYHYGLVPFRHMVEARSIDIMMVDLFRVGGFTEYVKAAHLAEAFNLPVVTHLATELFAHAAAGTNTLLLEHVPWAFPLFEEVPQVEEGMVVLGDEPGLGLRFDEAYLRANAVDA